MTVSTAERASVINPAHRILSKHKKVAKSAVTREQLIKDLKASKARFERGENDNNDVWALDREIRAYADRLLRK